MNINIIGDRPGETQNIDEEDIRPDYEKKEISLGITTNKKNPSGFFFVIEDEREGKSIEIRLTVDKVKFMMRHIIDEL